MPATVRQQLERNIVALISLAVALSSLGYATWRNERTEDNRNVRAAAFEMLVTLGDLQQVVFFAHYDRDASRGNPREGWTHVLVLEDLSRLVPAPVPQRTDRLKVAWAADWEGLGNDEPSARRISAALDETRVAVLEALRALD